MLKKSNIFLKEYKLTVWYQKTPHIKKELSLGKEEVGNHKLMRTYLCFLPLLAYFGLWLMHLKSKQLKP